MIISVHTPKTGGISFRNILIKFFGDALKSDYGDFPINKSFKERTRDLEDKRDYISKNRESYFQNFRCIHGHFMPYKYAELIPDHDVSFVTWLRDPLERLASHYYFWRRAYDPNRAAALHRRVVEEDWSFRKFCLSEEMKNLYAQYFWRFPLKNFEFIGITEHYDIDIQDFSYKILKNKLTDVPRDNVNPQNKTYFTDHGFVRELREFHAIDLEIYEEALQMREIRMINK